MSQIASEPRKILETRKRFMEQAFTSTQVAEAEVQRLLHALMQVRQCASRGVLVSPTAERCARACFVRAVAPCVHDTQRMRSAV
jgi:hypothetical protein